MSQEGNDHGPVLKPCPFCGRPGRLIRVAGDLVTAGCDDYDCIGYCRFGKRYNSEADAREHWNRRAEQA